MARLPYLEADQVAPEYRDMLKRNTNLHKLLVNSPDMARAFNGIGGYIRFKSKLDPRLRELAILIHDVTFILFVVAIVFHIYLGTAAEPGTFFLPRT